MFSGHADRSSYLKGRTALTVYQAQDKQPATQKRKSILVDRTRAETPVFRLARQERDTWDTWPVLLAALMAVEVVMELEKQSGRPVTIGAALLQRVLQPLSERNSKPSPISEIPSDNDDTVKNDLTDDLDLRFDGAEDILRAQRKGQRPNLDLTVSEWACAHRWKSV